MQALLVNRVRGARRQWIVPIDECYALVGLIRTHWRGFTGGAEVWQELDALLRPAGPAQPGRETERWPSRSDATHVKGIKSGQLDRQLRAQEGPQPRRHVDAERSTGINAATREPIDPRMPNLSPA